MAGLLEHVMINKLGDDLDEAITFVGGDTSNVSHISEYPKVIKQQLTQGASLTIHEMIIPEQSKIITSTDTGTDSYSTDYSTGIKSGLEPNTQYLRLCMALVGKEPVYIDMSTLSTVDDTHIMDIVLNSQEFNNLIDKTNSLESEIENIKNSSDGELKEVIVEEDNYIIIADSLGRDYYNTRYATGVKTGLEPGSMYIRLCTAVKNIEPIYISLDTLVKNLPSGDVNIEEITEDVINSKIFNEKLKNEIDNSLLDINDLIQTNATDIIMIKDTTNTLSNTIEEIDNKIINIENVLNNGDDDGLNEEETDKFFK